MIDLAPGQGLGERFVLVRRLAEGASSEVWLAEDTQRRSRVALKLFDPGQLGPPAALERLRGEMEAARSLPPGTAVEVRALHQADGLLLLEMEYLPGGDLRQFRGRSFTVFAGVLGRVAEALAAAHDRGLVHRDLKCANVLLDGEGRPRLADFGLATLTGAIGGGGSPYNMSPQQLRNEPARPADDLYAFGAMLYELLAGHPPYYPDVTRDRILHEPVPPLVPRAPAPERVRQLALRLLAKAPAERPASMRDVARELSAAAAEPSGDTAAPPAPRPATGLRRAARRGRRWLVPAAAVGLAVAAAAVFLWLPKLAERRAAEAQAVATAAATGQAERARSEREAAAALARDRGAAEQARADFEQRLATAQAANASLWAVARLAAARDAGDAAAGHFERAGYRAAQEGWERGSAALDALAQDAPAALAEALETGARAIEAGQSQAATDAFRLALAIEPGNAAAAAGLERAGKLDQVLALLEAAARDERAGRLTAALGGFRQALELDPATAVARAGIARVQAGLAGEAYAAAMSRGLAALAAGRDTEARAAFERARALRPDSVEVRDALQQLESNRRARRLEELARDALAAEQEERWRDAERAWSAALAIEPALVPAQAGRERVAPRVELESRLDGMIGKPEQLWDPDGRDAARRAMTAAGAVAAPRERLAAKVARLAALLQAAETPVAVPLESDGATEVVIYRVGRLGAFERHAVSLLPGRYAVVGTRSGYRDVRIELVVQPGAPPPPVMVRCEEPL